MVAAMLAYMTDGISARTWTGMLDNEIPTIAASHRPTVHSGEYGFGIFMSPMTPGVDCPSRASFLGVTMHNDFGAPFETSDSVCAFERMMGDQIWRHYEFNPEDQKPAEGRPWKEFALRHAAQVGNYDYLIDFIFMHDGTIRFRTVLGSHFFNFLLDFDIDGQDNDYVKAKLVPTAIDAAAGVERTPIWTLQKVTPGFEIPARTVLNTMEPSNLLIVNQNEKVGLGHNPAYQLVPGGSYVSDLLSADDYPVVRIPYIQHQLMISSYDPDQIYAGGEFVVASTGNGTLKSWTDANRSIANTDIVAWYTVGFHYVPRTEDWPVMPKNWKLLELRPFNFFPANPSIKVAPSMAAAAGSHSDAPMMSVVAVITSGMVLAVLLA